MNGHRSRRARTPSRRAVTLLGILGILGHVTADRAALAKSAVSSSAAAAAPLPLAIELVAKAPTLWTVRVKNTGDARLTVPADPRLIALELASAAPASGKPAKRAAKAVVCALPPKLRPERDEAGTLALDPGATMALDFDPRLVCFSQRDAEALVAAERITARYSLPGFSAMPAVEGKRPLLVNTATSEPIEVAAEARPPVRGIAEPAPPPTTGSQPSDAEDEAEVKTGAGASVRAAARIDGVRAATISIRVDVTNVSGRTRTAFVRPGSIGFLVEGPSGAFTCPTKGTPPIRELQRTLTSRATASVDVLLGPTCAGRSFDRPGLYVVRPVFSSTKPAWDRDKSLSGEHVGPPSLIRLQTARRPLLTRPPRLE